VRIAASLSDVAGRMNREILAGEKAVSTAIAGVAKDVKDEWRGQITGAGLGRRLANTVRSQVYPKGEPSLRAAALIWLKAPKILSAFEQGVTIRAREGVWLAIPLPAAGKSSRGGRITPAEFEQRRGLRLRFVYRRGKASLLVAEGRLGSRGTVAASKSKTGRGVATVPVFALVPQVKLRKRLNLLGEAERMAGSVPGRIVNAWAEDRFG
jgi:hypothetical protein